MAIRLTSLLHLSVFIKIGASLVAQRAEESACHAGDPGSIPGSGRCPGEGNGSPLQYSCLENPMDGGAGGFLAAEPRGKPRVSKQRVNADRPRWLAQDWGTDSIVSLHKDRQTAFPGGPGLTPCFFSTSALCVLTPAACAVEEDKI